MDESYVKRRKQYVYSSKSKSKTCLIHAPWNSSNECKVLGDFDARYPKGKPTKDHRNNPVLGKKISRHQENNAVINNTVDKILLNETKKVSAANHEAPEFLDSDYDENDMYQVEKWVLKRLKKNRLM